MRKLQPSTHLEVITSKTCVACGACCISLHNQDVFADVDEDDLRRMGSKLSRKLCVSFTLFDILLRNTPKAGKALGAIKTKEVEETSGPLKGVVARRCVCLEGSLLKKVKCSIYKVRPDCCRVFEPGNSNCRWIRNEFKRAAKENKHG